MYQKKKVTASFDFLSEIDMEPSRPTFTVDLRLSETQGRYDILKSQLNSIWQPPRKFRQEKKVLGPKRTTNIGRGSNWVSKSFHTHSGSSWLKEFI